MNIRLIVIASFSVYAFSSCVTSKLYKELEKEHVECQDQVDVLTDENERLTVDNNEFNARYKKLEDKIEGLENDNSNKEYEIKRCERENSRIQEQYSDLKHSQESLIRGNVEESKKLLKQLQTNQEDLQQREDKLYELKSSLEREQATLQILKTELEQKNARVLEMERILNRKDSAVAALREKVANALLGFEKEGLKVSVKNGKVYVSLEEKLLFGSGSTEVDSKGVSALKKLGKVLEQNPDINIMIEGHTDDVPFKSGSSIKDNWDLSVQRATAIVRILLDNSKIAPERLAASGRGEFSPIDNRKTPEARQKNRRTEIILTPKLDELFKVLESN